MALPKPNPFEALKVDFKTETKLDWNHDIGVYLQYVQYRVLIDVAKITDGVRANLWTPLDDIRADVKAIKSIKGKG